MTLKVKKKQRETTQGLVRRFQKAIQRSGILVEVRRGKFKKKEKSKEMQRQSALRRERIKKERELSRKLK